LEIADISDITGVISNCPVFLGKAVNGRNIRVNLLQMKKEYRTETGNITFEEDEASPSLANWLIKNSF